MHKFVESGGREIAPWSGNGHLRHEGSGCLEIGVKGSQLEFGASEVGAETKRGAKLRC